MTSNMDSCSDTGDTVHFISVPRAFRPGEDALVKYQRTSSVTRHSRDWVGLFRVGWTSNRDYYTFEWAPTDPDEGQYSQTKFSGSRLPHEDGHFYQFCYVSRSGEILGASRPFQFSKTAKYNINDDLEMVEVEDDQSLVLLRTKMDVTIGDLEKKVTELTVKNEDVENSMVIVRNTCDALKTDKENLQTQLNTSEEKNVTLVARIAELEQQVQEKDERIKQISEALEVQNEAVNDLQAAKTQVEEALKLCTEESTQQAEHLQVMNKQLVESDQKIAKISKDKQTVETELRTQCNTLEEKVRALEEENQVLLGRNEYYNAQSDRLEEVVQAQRQKIDTLEQENVALGEQLDKEKNAADELREVVSLKDQEINVAQANLCEVMGNMKEPRDFIPEKQTPGKVDKSALEALQLVYSDVEVQWLKSEKENKKLKTKVVELEERVKLCHQEYTAVATENAKIKRQQGPVDSEDLKEKVRQLNQELTVFQEKHDKRIAEKNERMQQQQDVLDQKLQENAGLLNQQRAMQTVIDNLNHDNGEAKKEIHKLQEKIEKLQHQHRAKQPKVHHDDSRSCPVCFMKFPNRTREIDIQRHINGHFD